MVYYSQWSDYGSSFDKKRGVPMQYPQVDGVDYTPSGIEGLRDELAAMRDKSMEQWPEAIPVTVLLTHTIGVLAYMSDLMVLFEKATARNKELQEMYDVAVGDYKELQEMYDVAVGE